MLLYDEKKRDPNRCFASVTSVDGWRTSQCSRRGIIEEANGKKFCRQHSTDARKKRQIEIDKRYDEKEKERERYWAMVGACRGVSTSVLERISVKGLLKYKKKKQEEEKLKKALGL